MWAASGLCFGLGIEYLYAQDSQMRRIDLEVSRKQARGTEANGGTGGPRGKESKGYALSEPRATNAARRVNRLLLRLCAYPYNVPAYYTHSDWRHVRRSG